MIVQPLTRCDPHEWMGRGPCPYCEAGDEARPEPTRSSLESYGRPSSMDEATLFKAYRNMRPQGTIENTSDG